MLKKISWMRSHKHKHKHADNSDGARSIEMHIVLLWQKKPWNKNKNSGYTLGQFPKKYVKTETKRLRKKEFAIVTIHGTRAFADLHNVASRYLPLAPTNSCRFRVLPISCTLGHPLVNWTFRSLELLVSLDLYFIGHGVHALALPKPSHYLYLFFAVFRFRRDTSLMFFHIHARACICSQCLNQ